MSRIAATLSLAGGLLVVPPAQAQAYSFDQVLAQALATHPLIESRRSSLDAAKADVDAAEWQRYPMPTFETGSRVSGSSTPNSAPTSRLRVQQPLWTGGRITAGIEGAGFRRDAANFSVGESAQDLALRVIGGYTEALRQLSREEHLQRSVQEHQRLLDLISRRVEHQVSPAVDRELAESRMLQIQNDRSAASQARASALTQLAQLAGRPVRSVQPLPTEATALPHTMDDLLAKTVAASPTLARLNAEADAAETDITARRSALFPQLGVRYERDYGGLFPENRLLLVLEAQPGAGLSAASGADAARARYIAARQARESAVRDVRERVELDWNEFVAARERATLAGRARVLAAGVFDSYVRQYTTGRKTWLDVMNVVRDSVQSDIALADASAQTSAAALRLRVESGLLRLAKPPAP